MFLCSSLMASLHVLHGALVATQRIRSASPKGRNTARNAQSWILLSMLVLPRPTFAWWVLSPASIVPQALSLCEEAVKAHEEAMAKQQEAFRERDQAISDRENAFISLASAAQEREKLRAESEANRSAFEEAMALAQGLEEQVRCIQGQNG